jgi:hypothetical protein
MPRSRSGSYHASLPLVAKTVAKLSKSLVIASALLLCAQTHAQTLIYARSYAQTGGRLRARFPNGVLGATSDEKLAMLRGYEKTEIYCVSMIDGKRSLLFSDEGMNLEITPTGATLGAGKAYARGVLREWRTTPTPGAYDEPTAVYEINLDGSNRSRKLFETQPGETPALLNRQTKKAVFQGSLNGGKDVVFIYDVSTWKLLQSWDLTKLSQPHCPGCFPVSYGWLADGDRVFFNLDTGDEDDDQSKTRDVPGTYMATADGADLGGLPKHAGELHLPGYSHQPDTIPYLIGQLPDGDYLFRDHGLNDRPSPKAPRESELFIVLTDSDFRPKKQIPLQRPGIGALYLAPSGKYLAYVENRQIPNYRTESHLWGKDLESGEEKELFIAPPPNPPGSPEPNVVLNVLGWVGSVSE